MTEALAHSDADETDEHLVDMWLHNRSELTIVIYRREIRRLFAFMQKPLCTVTLRDLQQYEDSIFGKPATRARAMAAVKSLFSFAAKLRAIPFNVAAALRTKRQRDTLPDRVLTEVDVISMLAYTQGRNHALIRLAYAGGFRVSELVGIRWCDLAPANDGTLYVTVFGKGAKTRTVRVPMTTAQTVLALRRNAPDEAYVFSGRRGSLHPSAAWRIVRDAARLAGIVKPVSPHFLRHAHASHALDRGVKVTVIRDTLGHSSIAVTDRYVHTRPEESSGLALPV